MQVFDIIFIFLNIFWCYILYEFMGVFFDTAKPSNKVLHIITYTMYCVATLAVYFFIRYQLIFSIFNLLSLFALTFNYRSTVIRKVLAAVMISVTSMMAEVAVAMTFGYFNLSAFASSKFTSISGSIAIRLVLFAIVLVIKNFKFIRNGLKIPMFHWISIILLPVFSLYIGLLMFNIRWINNTTLVISILGILLINFGVFYLYDALLKAQTQETAQALLLEQNKSYERQFATIKESTLISNTIKHDFKHHLAAITGMIQNGNQDSCIDYISALTQTKNSLNNIVNSGNIVVDSILNFKLEKTIKNGVAINVNVCISNDLLVSPADMTVILGNLVDNAVEATQKIDGGKIDITIKETKGRFIFKISNTFDGVIKVKEKLLFTTKNDETNHGLGMESVRTIIAKYDGELTFNFTENIFTTMVLIYI